MADYLEFHAIRSTVFVGDVEGVVLGINITDTGSQYQVGHWNGKDYKEVWFPSFMVKGEKEQKVRIGFN